MMLTHSCIEIDFDLVLSNVPSFLCFTKLGFEYSMTRNSLGRNYFVLNKNFNCQITSTSRRIVVICIFSNDEFLEDLDQLINT